MPCQLFYFRAATCLLDPALPKRTILSIVSSIYVAAFILAFPNSYYSVIKEGQCYSEWPDEKTLFVYYVIFLVVALLIPLAIAACMYTCLVSNVISSSKKHTHSFSKQRRKENKTLLKTMICTVSVFGMVTIPYAVFLVTYLTLKTYRYSFFEVHEDLMALLNYVIFAISATNSSLNPLIYARKGWTLIVPFSLPFQKGHKKSFTTKYWVIKRLLKLDSGGAETPL